MDNIIFGIRPVAEAIEAGKQIEKLYIRKGAEGQLMSELRDRCFRHKVRVQEVPVEKLNRLTRGNHQGVVAQISAIEYVGLADILERVPEDETPLVVIFDGVTDVRNFGAIARSAECAGAHGLITPLKNSAPVNAEAIRSSDGDSGLPRGFDPQYGQTAADRGIPDRRCDREEPQTALRRRFPQADGFGDGRRGYGHLERGAETLRRAAGDSADRTYRVAERLGGGRRDAVRSGAPANRRIIHRTV